MRKDGMSIAWFLVIVTAGPASTALGQSAEMECPMHQTHQREAAGAGGESGAHAGHAASPYARAQGEEIKALTAAELQAYREGTGMGLAKPAELNHYPGPRHALDLRGEIGLTDAQATALESAFQRMHAAAVELGDRIVEKEEELDRAFASGSIDEPSLRRLTGRIGGLQAELRAVHLAAHLETRRLLTAEQVARYDALRGYASSSTP
ncbi:MAG: Spy/CpxP family protein refolding chaperone [Syntrophomonadaceae bacterium]